MTRDVKQQILNHFNGNYSTFYKKYLQKVKSIGKSEYQALCPFHDDTNRSLSFNSRNGQYYCHGCPNNGNFFRFYAELKGLDIKRDFRKVLNGVADDFGITRTQEKSRVVKHYVYRDITGEPLHRTVRTEPKGFYQQRYENGKWIPGLKGIEPVLYRLPEISKADEILICEGEKDADNLAELSFTATTCPMGAKKWRNSYNQYLEGKRVILIPDNDNEGKEHMAQIGASLSGKTANLKLLELPGLANKQDVSDFIKSFKSPEEAAERISLMIEQAEPYTPQTDRIITESIIDENKIKEKAIEILNARQPCGKYDLSNLPLVLKDCCQEICSSTQAEPIMVAQSLIVTISALIKKKACIQAGEYFQNLYPVIWAISIADSGDFKSTAIQKGARLAYEREKDIQEQIECVDDEDKKQINQARQRSALLPNRSTAEALLEHLANDQGGMIICTEVGEWLENLEKTHNKGFKALIIDLFDVPPHYGYSTKGGGYLIIREPFISINGVSTLTWIKENSQLGDVNSGFFARFLMFYPPKKSIIPPALPHQIAHRDFQPLDRIRQTISDLPENIDFKLSHEGREYFEAVHAELYKTVRKENETTQQILNPYLKRWSPYILKLAMLMQIFIDPHTNKIGAAAIKSAKSIVDYAIKSTTYLFQNQLGESEHQAKERKVIEYIAGQGGKVIRSQLQRSHTLASGTEEYDCVCNSLEVAGKLRINCDPLQKKDWEYILSD